MQDNENSLVYTIKELSEKLKISESSTYQLVRANVFPKVKIGKRILIPVEGIKKWLNENAC